MSRASHITAIVIWSIIALVLGAILIVGLTAGFPSDISFGIIYSKHYAEPDSYSVGNADISDTVTNLDIHWQNGSVRIEAYDGQSVLAEEEGRYGDDYRMRYRYRDGTLSVQYCKAKIFWGFFRQPRKPLTIKIPYSMAEELGQVAVECVSACLTVEGISTQSLKIDHVSGDVALSDFSADVMDIDAVSGDFTVDGSFSTLNMDVVSGDSEITGRVMPSEIDYDAVSGNLTMTLADGNGFTARFDGVSGDFYSSFPTERTDKEYVYADGSAHYDFETVSGDVTLRRQQDTEE